MPSTMILRMRVVTTIKIDESAASVAGDSPLNPPGLVGYAFRAMVSPSKAVSRTTSTRTSAATLSLKSRSASVS